MSAAEHPSDEKLWLDEPSVRRHVEACPTCLRAREATRRRQEAVAAALAAATTAETTAETSMPQPVEHRLAAALQDEVRGGIDGSDGPDSAARTGHRSLGAGLAAAAVVLVLVGTVLGVRGSSDPVAGGSAEDVLVGSAEPAEQIPDTSLSDSADSRTARVPPVPPSLVEEAERDDSERAGSVQDGCGNAVLDDTGEVVLAVAEVTTDPRGGVLVTVDGDNGVVLWWLPSCQAGADEAYGRSARP